MKYLLLISLLLPTLSLSECNLANDIKKTDQGYLYTPECHQLVGKTFMENQDQKAIILSYKELVELQKISLKLQTERADLWYTTSKDLEERIIKIDQYGQWNNYIHVVAGIALTIGAGWALGQAGGR